MASTGGKVSIEALYWYRYQFKGNGFGIVKFETLPNPSYYQ